MTERRRPAAAGRVLAAGLSAATTLSLTGLYALEPVAVDSPVMEERVATTAPPVGPAAVPRKVVVVRRIHLTSARPPAQVAGAPATPVPTLARPQPRTRTRGS